MSRSSEQPADRAHGEGRLPEPEFLALTLTLPCHLLRRVDDIAEDSLRSRSEVVADALRLYVKACRARERHAQISTVEGFSYREIEVSDTGREPPAGPLSPPPALSAVTGTNGAGVAHVSNGNGAKAAPAAKPEAVTPAGETPSLAGASQEPPGTADMRDPIESDSGGAEATSPGDPPSLDVETATTPEAATATRTAVPERVEPVAAAPPQPPVDSASTGHSPEAGREPEPDSRSEAQAQRGSVVTVEAADSGVESTPEAVNAPEEASPTESRETLSDPAAAIRRRLQDVAEEPITSARLRTALARICSELDVRDGLPEDHSAVVSKMARELAEAVGVRGTELRDIELAGLVHDLGKACIPREILSRRRPSPEEMAILRQYPDFGVELLSLVPALAPLQPIVGSHQERWNGNGYPDGRQGTDIPRGAQIVALCDVYQVLLRDRHYRPAYSEESALQIVRQNVGTLWNPEIGRAFLRLFGGS